MSQEDGGKTTRRNTLKGIGTIGTAAVLGGAGLVASAGSAAASEADFDATGASVETPDGEIHKVYVTPQGTGTWSNFDEVVESIRVKIDSRILDKNADEQIRGWSNVFDQDMSLGATSGKSGNFNGENVGPQTLYGGDSGRSVEPFNSPEDGKAVERVVEIRLTLHLHNSAGELADPREEAVIQDTMKFRATVKNLEATASASGTFEGGINATAEDSDE